MKHIILFLALAFMLASCSSSDPADPVSPSETEQAVTFAAYSARFADADTRAAGNTLTGTRATVSGTTPGNIGLEDLRLSGFGVFAYSTGSNDYTTGSYIPNFMYNQLVADTASTGTWSYSPRKFWPTDGGKLSFFAYAPYLASSTSQTSIASGASLASGASTTIALSPNTSTSAPTVTYHLTEGGDNVDLLWGASSDGSALVNLTKAHPNINFYFRHALTKVGGMKQDNDKEAALTINLDGDDSLADASGPISQGTKVTLSRVLIEQVGIVASGSSNTSGTSLTSGTSQTSQTSLPRAFASGTLDLYTGSWTINDNNLVSIDTTKLSPYRQLIVPIDSFKALSAQATINSSLAEPAASKYVNDPTMPTGKRLLWDSIPQGITSTAQSVYGYELMPMLVMPASGYKPVLRLTVSYVVRTHDPWLLAGHSEMRETLSRVFTLSEEPLPAHRYHINIHLGLHSIRLDGNLEEWQVQHGSIIHDRTTQQNLQGPDIHEEDPDTDGDNINWMAKHRH